MTRQEHMEWAKKRALEYVDTSPSDAFASMASDLEKHAETSGHIGVQMGMMQMMVGGLKGREEMRRFIEGFN